ncbi:rrf1p [Saccharomyces arboricola H-6]|uniref:Ribosome-recycling factor, mitochondrial n=1 Tax=Saccharomyces arboricola (strain H-6 / AS 2.3317 / CBS 10644) TaxID=1160507 RepID=J8PMR6_SACAR|nr:rrf1p [Saccharomyces arboricola H-6]
MFLTTARLNSRQITTNCLFNRPFSQSFNNLKKKTSPAAEKVEEDEADLNELLERAETRFKQTLEVQKHKLSEVKQGNFNPKVFNSIIFKNNRKFTDIATTSLKGKNALLITVFDPKDVKTVISGVLAANLNLTPERIPNNDLQLKVSLPPPTTESRMRVAKDLKRVFEEYKQSSLKDSLGTIRGTLLKELKSFKKDDAVRKAERDLEKLHKDYVNKLHDQFQQMEKSVTK